MLCYIRPATSALLRQAACESPLNPVVLSFGTCLQPCQTPHSLSQHLNGETAAVLRVPMVSEALTQLLETFKRNLPQKLPVPAALGRTHPLWKAYSEHCFNASRGQLHSPPTWNSTWNLLPLVVHLEVTRFPWQMWCSCLEPQSHSVPGPCAPSESLTPWFCKMHIQPGRYRACA